MRCRAIRAPTVAQQVHPLCNTWPRPPPLVQSPLVVIGHSLGGAFATLASLDMLLFNFAPSVRTVTFGSPRVGNTVYADLFNDYVTNHLRVTHNHEIVPSTPPELFGYHHVAREVFVAPVEEPEAAANARRGARLASTSFQEASQHRAGEAPLVAGTCARQAAVEAALWQEFGGHATWLVSRLHMARAAGVDHLGGACATCVGTPGRLWVAAMHVLLGG